MNRKDFIKKTALGMVATAFAQWDLKALDHAGEVDKWYYFRNVYSEKHQEKTYYHYNSIMLSFDWEKPVVNEVIVADHKTEFPAGSFTVSRTKPMFKKLEEGKLIYRRQGTTVWGFDLTKRKRDRSNDNDFIFMQYRWLDLSDLKEKQIIKISQDNKRWIEVDLMAHFDRNSRTFIKKGNPDMIIPPCSHQTKEWIASQEKEATTRQEEPIASSKPKQKKSFIAQQKEKLGAQEKQRISKRKYEIINSKEYLTFKGNSIKYLFIVEMEGKLVKGDRFKMSIKNTDDFRNQPTQRYTFEYELLEDFKRKQAIKIKCISNQNNYADMGSRIGIRSNDFFRFNKILIKKVSHFSDGIWSEPNEATIYVGNEFNFSVGGRQTPDGCYLTTACVRHRGLADDCKELKTLRHFRDTYMKSSTKGASLIQRYYKVAPQMVTQIESRLDRQEVLEFIYQKLVLASIELIEEGKKELAMEYYAAFTLALEKEILNG